MADTGWLSPGTTVDDAGVGTKIWNNPNNAQSSDDNYADSIGGAGGGTSHYLKATNFGAAVPVGATIDGIVVEFERKANLADNTSDFRIYIVKADGTYGVENKAAGGFWSTVEAYFSYGGAADLWSLAWTPANINHANFGVVLSALMLANGRAYVDHVRIKVYYTLPATNMKVNIGDVFKDVDSIKINIGDVWKDVVKIQINIGDVWKDVFG